MTKETLSGLLDAAAGEHQVFEKIALAGGEITPEIEVELEILSNSLATKIDSYRNFTCLVQSRIVTIAEEVHALKKLQVGLCTLVDKMNEYLICQMKSRGLTELKGNKWRYVLSTCAKRTIITDETAVPAKFKTVITTEKVDKSAVKDAIVAGEEVPGAHLEGGDTIRGPFGVI